MTAVPEVRVVNEIPDAVKKLASFIARAFYGIEHSIVMDLLKRNIVMREGTLQEVTKFDIKQLRAIIIGLKQDKLIKERQRVEEGANGRKTRLNYYFINYRAVINVTKYKIDHMRRSIADRLMDFSTGLMMCMHCKGEVEEDETAGPSQDTRSSLTSFNEQLIPFFRLLQELDGIQLSPHLLEPPLPEAEDGKSQERGTGSNAHSHLPFGSHFGGNRPREFELYQQGQGMDVQIEGSARDTTETGSKQVPVWLQDQTKPGMELEQTTEPSPNPNQIKIVGLLSPTGSISERDEIISAALRAHETGHSSVSEVKEEEKTAGREGTIRTGLVDSSHTRDEEEEEESEEELESVEEEVRVQGKSYRLGEILFTPQLVEEMTAEEKADYIRISQQAMESIY